MARVVKNKQPWHVITVVSDEAHSDLTFLRLNRDRRSAFFVVRTKYGDVGSRICSVFSGPKTLRALARAILRTVPAPKRNTKRRK